MQDNHFAKMQKQTNQAVGGFLGCGCLAAVLWAVMWGLFVMGLVLGVHWLWVHR